MCIFLKKINGKFDEQAQLRSVWNVRVLICSLLLLFWYGVEKKNYNSFLTQF